MTNNHLTSTGKTFRWALMRDGSLLPYSNAWKLWVEGSEIYALCSPAGESTKISFHESGENHFRPHERETIGLFPPATLPDTDWRICFEWRFVLEEHCQPRTNQFIGITKRKMLHGASILNGQMLVVQLLIGPKHYADDAPSPWNAAAVWRKRLKNGTVAMLLMSTHEINPETRQAQEQLQQRNTTPNLDSEPPWPVDFDVLDLHTYPHINFLIVQQMRHESIIVHPAKQQAPEGVTLSVPIGVKPFQLPLLAPDGQEVAKLEFDEFATDAVLQLGRYREIELGLVRLQCDPNKLLPGQNFRMRSLDINNILQVGKNSIVASYSFDTRYNGSDLCVTFKPLSRGINRDIFSDLAHSHQIILQVTHTFVKLNAARTGEVASTTLKARMLWRQTPRAAQKF